MPKAGTQLFRTALSALGVHDTGYHLFAGKYLDTKQASKEASPLEAEREAPFVDTLERIPDNSLCFGHLSPMFFPIPILQQFSLIISIRQPKEVLVAEFTSLRFERTDVNFISRESVEDDNLAFIKYLKRFIPIQEMHFRNYFSLKDLIGNWLYRANFSNPVLETKFSSFLSKEAGPIYLQKIKGLFSLVTSQNIQSLHQRIIDAYHQLKAPTSDQELWSKKARELYNNSQLVEFEPLIEEIGL